MINVPYTELDLESAFLELQLSSAITDEKANNLEAAMNAMYPQKRDVAARNKKIAEENGIGVETLINSPNYSTLVAEYERRVIEECVRKCQELFGISEMQAWALIAKSFKVI